MIHGDLLTCIMSPLEVFRRFVWNYLRLENEHVNNCGQFRAVRDISVKPIRKGDLESLLAKVGQDMLVGSVSCAFPDGSNGRRHTPWSRSPRAREESQESSPRETPTAQEKPYHENQPPCTFGADQRLRRDSTLVLRFCKLVFLPIGHTMRHVVFYHAQLLWASRHSVQSYALTLSAKIPTFLGN